MQLKRNFFTGILFAFSAIAMAQHHLGYRLEQGAKFTLKQVAQQEMVMQIDSTQQIITNEMEALYAMQVDQKEAGVYLISFEFLDFAIKSSSNIQGLLMDVRASAPVEGDLMSTIFSGLIGIKLELNMKENGAITAVAGTDALINQMLSGATLDDFTKNLMKQSLENQFSSESLSSSFEQMTFIYPNTTGPVGHEWTTAFKGKLDATNNWKLNKVAANTLFIAGEAAITVAADEGQIKMDLKGTQQTQLEASATNGFPQKMSTTGSMTGISTMAMAQGVSIPTTLTQTITYTLIKA